MEFSATVEYLSAQGLGTIRDGTGRTYFVRAVWPGDRGVFRATSEREGRYQFAELVRLIEASGERREVPCQHFGVGHDKCYGCPWIIADEAAQLRQKLHRLSYAFERVGLDTASIRPLWEAPEAFGYRSRAQIKTDGRLMGYAGLQGQAIAPIGRCLTMSPQLNERYQSLRERLPRREWEPTPPHIWNFIEIDEEFEMDDLQLCRRRPFQQANKAQNERMKDWIRSNAVGRHVLELFCGSGNLTEALADEKDRLIDAFEVGEEAVRTLERKRIPNVSARRVDLYDRQVFPMLQSIGADLLCVNPPRAGLMKLTRLAQTMASLKEILYVSCDIQTLVTDLQKILKAGFHLAEVQPVDQMPQTPHLEVLVRLIRA